MHLETKQSTKGRETKPDTTGYAKQSSLMNLVTHFELGNLQTHPLVKKKGQPIKKEGKETELFSDSVVPCLEITYTREVRVDRSYASQTYPRVYASIVGLYSWCGRPGPLERTLYSILII